MHHPTLPLLLAIPSTLALTRPPLPILTLNNYTHPPLSNSEIYPPTCLRLPSLPGLAPTTCELAIPVTCEKLTRHPPHRLVRDKWIWVDLPGCATGYYLPEGAEVPAEEECEIEIFGGIWRKCAEDSRWNAGGVNVEVVPGEGGAGTGVVPGEVRYLLAPKRLTPETT